ncbi:MAG: T9SS type A sorting domain-containing protein [bacterium]|nr:T9SS type A sorting domain-containing protein [bacterium]
MFNFKRDVLLFFLLIFAKTVIAGTWSSWIPVDTNTISVSYNAFASKTPGSRKMCIVWGKNILEDGLWNGHIIYRESHDGGKNWGNKIDIISLIKTPTPHYYTIHTLKNSVGNAYGIYDYKNNLHIVTDASLGTATEGSYYPALCCALWHFSSEYDSIYMISSHPYPYPSTSVFKWMQSGGGVWSDVLYPYYGGLQAKPVISEDPVTKILYVIWVEFPIDTYGIAGYEAGEIYASYSLDRGRKWAPKMNLTMTPADCEVFATMAPIVNDTLHFMYELDLSGYDDIAKQALDPNKNPFITVKKPVKKGDVSVLSINSPACDPDSLTPGDTVIPKVTYRNNGTETVNCQARFEITKQITMNMGDSTTTETLVTPEIMYYDVKNLTLASGETQVAFKPYTVINDTTTPMSGLYEASVTMLIDTLLNNNYTDTIWALKKQKKGEKSYDSPCFNSLNQTITVPNIVDKNITTASNYLHYNKFATSGDTFGCTQYDRQWNRSPQRRIMWDPRNNFTHTLWMKQLTAGGVERHMFYNCNEGAAWSWPGLNGGAPVQTSARDGYGAMDLDTAGNAVVAMHKLVGTRLQTCVYVDALPGMGSFGVIKEFPHAPGDSQTIWPVVAVDGVGDMIVLAYADTTLNQPMSMNKLWYSSYLVDVNTQEPDFPVGVFAVSSIYPAPAKNIANIKYYLPYTSSVVLKMYDVTGKLVKTLVNETRKAGSYVTLWDGKNSKGNKVSTGLYFCKVEACSKVETRKIVLVK